MLQWNKILKYVPEHAHTDTDDESWKKKQEEDWSSYLV